MKIASWNISSARNVKNEKKHLFDIDPDEKVDDSVICEIAKAIKTSGADVICLQEVPFIKDFDFLKKLSDLLDLKYYEYFITSPGFLIKDSKMGLAVLSKYPLEVNKKQLFENPKLEKKTGTGVSISHDKGFISVKVLCEDPITLVSTHFIPFHRFDSDILDYKYLFKDFEEYIKREQAVVCGDFNSKGGREVLRQIFDGLQDDFDFVFDTVTTENGRALDNIILPKKFKIKREFVINKTPSDHFLIGVEIKK